MSEGRLEFESLWREAAEEPDPDPEKAAGRLVQAWANLLGSEVLKMEKHTNIAVFLLDFSQLLLRGLDTNIVIVVHPVEDHDSKQKVYHELERFAAGAFESSFLCFAVFLQDSLPIVNEVDSGLIDLVVLDGHALEAQFQSLVPDEEFFRTILRQVSMARLCPFDTTRPARGAMFAGRREQLRALVENQDTNFLITGGRRIGKSSLLLRMADILKGHKKLRGQVIYLVCETWSDLSSAARHIASAMDFRREPRIGIGTSGLENLFKVKSHYGQRPLTLLLDEFDRIADSDMRHGWPVAKCLYSATVMGYIRVVFAGYRSVIALQESQTSPFFEKLRLLSLPNLQYEDVQHLLLRPLLKVGIHIAEDEREEITDRILYTSAGHPFLVQFYGERLFDNLVRNNRKQLRTEDIDLLETGFEFSDHLASYFLENTAARERLLAFLYAFFSDGTPWSEGDFQQHLTNMLVPLSLDQIHGACRNLELANIFRYRDYKYSFSVPVFQREITRRWQMLRDSLKQTYEAGLLDREV